MNFKHQLELILDDHDLYFNQHDLRIPPGNATLQKQYETDFAATAEQVYDQASQYSTFPAAQLSGSISDTQRGTLDSQAWRFDDIVSDDTTRTSQESTYKSLTTPQKILQLNTFYKELHSKNVLMKDLIIRYQHILSPSSSTSTTPLQQIVNIVRVLTALVGSMEEVQPAGEVRRLRQIVESMQRVSKELQNAT